MNPIEEFLAAIEARENKATKGRWSPLSTSQNMTGVHAINGPVIYHARFDPECLPETHDRQRRDAEFIAHARTDIPALLALVRKYREALEQLSVKCDCPRHECPSSVARSVLAFDPREEGKK